MYNLWKLWGHWCLPLLFNLFLWRQPHRYPYKAYKAVHRRGLVRVHGRRATLLILSPPITSLRSALRRHIGSHHVILLNAYLIFPSLSDPTTRVEFPGIQYLLNSIYFKLSPLVQLCRYSTPHQWVRTLVDFGRPSEATRPRLSRLTCFYYIDKPIVTQIQVVWITSSDCPGRGHLHFTSLPCPWALTPSRRSSMLLK